MHVCLVISTYSYIIFITIDVKLKEIFNKKVGQKRLLQKLSSLVRELVSSNNSVVIWRSDLCGRLCKGMTSPDTHSIAKMRFWNMPYNWEKSLVHHGWHLFSNIDLSQHWKKRIIVSQKGFIHNLIMVRYQKYGEVCDAIVRMINLLLSKKIHIFKVKEILCCHNY